MNVSPISSIFFGIVLFLLKQNAISQEILPIPQHGIWIFQSGGMSAQSDPIVRTPIDTVTINEVEYVRLANTEHCPLQDNINGEVFLREDSGKWYTYLTDENIETLICDFTLDVGDTIELYHHYFSEDSLETLVVDTIEWIDLGDGVQRRKWTLAFLSCLDPGWGLFWIEGVGSQHYFNYQYPPCVFDGGWFSLQCFGDNEASKVPLNSWSDCCWIGATDEIDPGARFNVYPSPASTIVNIELQNAANNYSQLFIYDVNGKTFWSLKPGVRDSPLQIDISDWPTGFYFVVSNSARVVSSAFIVKE